MGPHLGSIQAEDFTAVCGTLEDDEVIQRFQSRLEKEDRAIGQLTEKLTALR